MRSRLGSGFRPESPRFGRLAALVVATWALASIAWALAVPDPPPRFLHDEITTTGPTKTEGSISSTAPLATSRPETQWIGASKCVPVCSFIEMLCHFQAGPRPS